MFRYDRSFPCRYTCEECGIDLKDDECTLCAECELRIKERGD